MTIHEYFGDINEDGRTLTKPKHKRPPMYCVIILNDDFTAMQFVVQVLISISICHWMTRLSRC
jgi:ATP-dependent Clp protease adapter protein ClpS